MMRRKLVKKENVKGGEGTVLFDYLLGDEQLQGMCGMYAKVTLPPGSSIGYHTHEGDSESYYILSGKGTYINNNKEEMEIFPNDVTFTADGEGHSIINTGTEKLVFIAMIINSEKKETAE